MLIETSRIKGLDQPMIIENLHDVFENRKRRRPGYSLRAFAKSLELDASCLSALLKSKRKLTFKMAQKIVENVKEFSPEQRYQLLEGHAESANENSNSRMLLNDKFSLISDWWNFAILAIGRNASRWLS